MLLAKRQWRLWRGLAVNSCGRSHGIDASRISPCSLFVIHALAHMATPSRILKAHHSEVLSTQIMGEWFECGDTIQLRN
jgi:hypothetical protein